MTALGRGLGYLPDPHDENDFDALKVIRGAASPPARVPRCEYTITLDQGELGSCVAHTGVQGVRVDEVRQLVDAGMLLEEAQARVEFPSRLWGYYFARAIHHATQLDSGTHLRFFFQALNKFGFAPESIWSYTDSQVPDPNTGLAKFQTMPSGEAFRLAFDQRLIATQAKTSIVTYSRVPGDGYTRVENVKRALADARRTPDEPCRRLVMFGTDVSREFCNDSSANGGKPIDPPKGKIIAGGHAMALGGYDERGVDVLNSWSERFGDRGWFQMTWDYIAWEETRDLWIVERAPILLAA